MDRPVDDPIWDDSSRRAKEFRRRFRVPYALFMDIVAKARGWFGEPQDRAGRKRHPLPLKVLGVLRVLGCNTYFHLLTELTGMSEETHRTFFKAFIEMYAEEVFPEVCAFPKSDAEIRESRREYDKAGLAGAFCSVDCVHFRCV